LFPLLSLALKKCELATNSVIDVAASHSGVCSVESFREDLRAFATQVIFLSVVIIIIVMLLSSLSS